jgi:hypothetical protein
VRENNAGRRFGSARRERRVGSRERGSFAFTLAQRDEERETEGSPEEDAARRERHSLNGSVHFDAHHRAVTLGAACPYGAEGAPVFRGAEG